MKRLKVFDYYENPIDYIFEIIKDFPNYIKNVIICYSLQHTRLYATTLYEFAKHTSRNEMNVYFKMTEVDKNNS